MDVFSRGEVLVGIESKFQEHGIWDVLRELGEGAPHELLLLLADLPADLLKESFDGRPAIRPFPFTDAARVSVAIGDVFCSDDLLEKIRED